MNALATKAVDADKMELADFKKLLHASMQSTLMDQYHDYLEVVKMSMDPEVKRKCVAMHIATIGAEHKEKVDPNDRLTVVNITFTDGGAMTASATPPVIEDQSVMGIPITDNLATLAITRLNPAARVALNRDVDFTEDDEC